MEHVFNIMSQHPLLTIVLLFVGIIILEMVLKTIYYIVMFLKGK